MAKLLQKARRTAILRRARLAEPVVPGDREELDAEPRGAVADEPNEPIVPAQWDRPFVRPAMEALPRNVRLGAPPERTDVMDEATPSPMSVVVAPTPVPRSALVPASRGRGKRRLVLAAVGVALASALSATVLGSLREPNVGKASADPWSAGRDLAAARDGEGVGKRLLDLAPLAAQRLEKLVVAEPVKAAPADARVAQADAHLDREGYGHITGGVVFVPSTFSSRDGAYDLYVHFHGNARVVLESAEHAGLDAIVAVVNLGVNSAPYLDAYDEPGAFERTLASIARALNERGLENGHPRRIAIGSWSGGYGAISRVLDRSPTPIDAVLVLDGIHCGFLDEGKKTLNSLVISPFVTGAQRAAEGKMLFSITHSEIDPVTYAGSNVTAAYLLDAVHGTSGEPTAPPPDHLQLKAAEGAVARKLEKHMDPFSEARVGSFHVRGYRGNTPEHHMAHLLQMGATVMPELAERWSRAPDTK